MSLTEIFIAVILRMPDIIYHIIQIRCSIIDRMLVETVKAGLVNDINDCIVGITDGHRRVADRHLTIRLGFQNRTEMNALQRVTRGMARQR